MKALPIVCVVWRMRGSKWRYPGGAPARVRKMLDHELNLISKLKYEPYFLTVRDVVHFARSRDILCQGRGVGGKLGCLLLPWGYIRLTRDRDNGF